MLFHCPSVAANFPAAGLRLVNRAPARLLWTEHGGTFVLRLEGLEVEEAPELQGQGDIRVEAELPEPADLAEMLEGFAGEHSLRLGPSSQADLAEKPMLAACHIPGKNLFIFCEEPCLEIRRLNGRRMALTVTGAFKARRVPCQETDVVIHLDLAAIRRLLAGLLAWTRQING